jgi:hypothetical protein
LPLFDRTKFDSRFLVKGTEDFRINDEEHSLRGLENFKKPFLALNALDIRLLGIVKQSQRLEGIGLEFIPSHHPF